MVEGSAHAPLDAHPVAGPNWLVATTVTLHVGENSNDEKRALVKIIHNIVMLCIHDNLPGREVGVIDMLPENALNHPAEMDAVNELWLDHGCIG